MQKPVKNKLKIAACWVIWLRTYQVNNMHTIYRERSHHIEKNYHPN